jgi:hypothetical protein
MAANYLFGIFEMFNEARRKHNVETVSVLFTERRVQKSPITAFSGGIPWLANISCVRAMPTSE